MGKHHEKLLNNLEPLRKAAGLTQQHLSEQAEVSRKYQRHREWYVCALYRAGTENCADARLSRRRSV